MNPLLQATYEYRPFVTPLPAWNHWWMLIFPLSLAIAVVYKCVRCESMRRVPREAAILFAFIIVVMVLAAGALAAIVKVLE